MNAQEKVIAAVTDRDLCIICAAAETAGEPEGILSADHIFVRAQLRNTEVCCEDVVEVLKKIYGPQLCELLQGKVLAL